MLFDLMRKRCLLDHAMFAESDNFEGEVTMDENPFIEEGASAEAARKSGARASARRYRASPTCTRTPSKNRRTA